MVDLADTVARTHGYDLGEYKRPEAQYHQEDDTWSLFYDQKPSDGIPEVGKHFSVTVDNKTKKAAIAPGD